LKIIRIKYLACLIILYFFLGFNFSYSEIKESSSNFYFDAVCFKGDSDTLSRLDVFVLVPYQSLNFVKYDDLFGASYELSVKALDSNRNTISVKKISRRPSESDYYIASGGTGKFDYSQIILNLPAGTFNIEVLLTDLYTNESFFRSRKLIAINFGAYKFSLSNILLVSSIEEREGKKIITPHVSDNIGELHEGFFTFFESYNNSGSDSADFVYEITNKKGELFTRSKKIRKAVNQKTNQHYIRIPYNDNFNSGAYTLRISAMKVSNSPDINNADIVAVAERSISFLRTVSGYSIADINKAVRQLRYVANGSEMDFIESATTQEDKLKRYVEFWKALDPTPNTERNEAYDEYLSRIEYSNKEFKSYSEGWQSDKGMVYVIYGKPLNIEKTSPMTEGKKYERWTYANNKQFLFMDNSGFGDFRLVSPPGITDRFKYTIGGN
jgi:GWxTD domain-containing protein